MAYKVALGVNWQGKLDFKGLIERAKLADDAGIAFDVGGRGVGPRRLHDAGAARGAHQAHQARHLDRQYLLAHAGRARAAFRRRSTNFRNGRMIIGLGTSGPQVIEHFHGVKFNPPLTRMKRVRRHHQPDDGRARR